MYCYGFLVFKMKFLDKNIKSHPSFYITFLIYIIYQIDQVCSNIHYETIVKQFPNQTLQNYPLSKPNITFSDGKNSIIKYIENSNTENKNSYAEKLGKGKIKGLKRDPSVKPSFYRLNQYCSYVRNQNVFKQRLFLQHSKTRRHAKAIESSYSQQYEGSYESSTNNYDETQSTTNSMLPEGCVYKDHNFQTQEIICSGSSFTDVPFIPIRNVNKITFIDTKIQILTSSQSISKLPRTLELAFYDGVLMEVNFGNLLQSQQQLKKLSIINNRIASFSFSKCFVSEIHQDNLETLNLQNNMIVFLPQPATTNTTTLHRLQTIDFSNNPMCVLPGDLFRPLRKSPVKTLLLQHASLFDIGPSVYDKYSSPLAYLPGLEVLDLSQNSQLPISKLDYLLSPLYYGNLTKLFLAYNNYIVVPTEALEKVKSSLVALDLQGSAINCLTNSSFPFMPKLKVLNLKFSRITTLSDSTFNTLPCLETLHLDGNNLTAIPPFIFPSLKVLTLDDNPAEDLAHQSTFKIQDKSFIGYSVLEKLSMDQNPLQSIRKNTFTGLTSLLHLKLRNCALSTLEIESFLDLQKLLTLDLSNNDILNISRETFSGLGRLKELDLSYNKIAFQLQPLNPTINFNLEFGINKTQENVLHMENAPEIPFESLEDSGSASHFNVFQDFSNLITLHLNDNSIRGLFPGIFQNMLRLQYLDLSYNRISSWDKCILTNNHHLNLLNLTNNGITRLTDAMIKDFTKSNLTVDLRGNTLICSCSLLAFNNEMNDTNFIDKDLYKCSNGTDLLFIDDYIQSWENKSQNCYEGVSFTDSNPILHRTSFKLYGILSGVVIIAVILSITTYRNRWYVKYLAYKFKVKTLSGKYNPELGIYEYDTFICYSHQDRQWVFEKLISQLEASGEGLNVCVHERDFLVGEEITQNIIRSVEMSRKVIVVISQAFVLSTWCMFELQMASNKILDERKNKLILILLEPLQNYAQPKGLRLLLKSRTYMPWVSDVDGQRLFWARLMRAIAKPTTMEYQASTITLDQTMRQSFSLSCSSKHSRSPQLDLCEESDDDVTERRVYIKKYYSNQSHENKGHQHKGLEKCQILSVKTLPVGMQGRSNAHNETVNDISATRDK